jgi:hypothetical protein
MRIALAVAVILLAGCVAKQQAAKFSGPVVIGKTDEAEAIARLGPPIKTVVAPNGAKNETFPFAMVKSALPEGQGPNGITYIFGTDGLLRHIIMENGSGARYLMQEKSTDSIQPDEIVGPMPTVVEMTIKRVS